MRCQGTQFSCLHASHYAPLSEQIVGSCHSPRTLPPAQFWRLSTSTKSELSLAVAGHGRGSSFLLPSPHAVLTTGKGWSSPGGGLGEAGLRRSAAAGPGRGRGPCGQVYPPHSTTLPPLVSLQLGGTAESGVDAGVLPVCPGKLGPSDCIPGIQRSLCRERPRANSWVARRHVLLAPARASSRNRTRMRLLGMHPRGFRACAPAPGGRSVPGPTSARRVEPPCRLPPG